MPLGKKKMFNPIKLFNQRRDHLEVNYFNKILLAYPFLEGRRSGRYLIFCLDRLNQLRLTSQNPCG